ncbi:cation acetate symporter [Skermania piniformis]|uniref:Cation acetate symporter n=1 Tax=Skermania pinensis TaxID=39122 RepID=A0ABX8SH15_9ACTN|nr:cation acetate symporter [Skermania piniformis]QXQ14971.1 cation acetate symporter [Skermania piniformis]
MTGSAPLTVSALVAVAVTTVVIGAYGVRLSRTTSDFLVASRSVGARWNAAAIAGEYLSAASFLGVAGLIAKFGADALWFPVGFTAGYLGLLLFVAAPLRRSGAYTVPDFAEFRLGSTRLRGVTTAIVVLICLLYLVPQYQGAGLTLAIVLGAPTWVGAVAVAAIVTANVVGGGMRSITFVQGFQFWLKLTAIAVPAVVLAGAFVADQRTLGDPAPPVLAERTTVDIRTDVVVQVATTQPVVVDGVASTLVAGRHEFAAGTTVVFEAGAVTPVVDGAPGSDADWLRPGNGFGGGHPTYQVYSLIVALFLGTMGLPHVLVRFYTNPEGQAARATALAVIGLVGLFYLFPIGLGVLARSYLPQLMITGTSDAAVLLLPGAAFGGVVGRLLAALVAAGALAAFLSTSSGLLVTAAAVLSTDLLPGRVRDFRVAAVIGGSVPVALSLSVDSLDVSRTVGLVFAVAASTLCPLLLLGIWWRGLTVTGAAAGLVVGGGSAAAATTVAALGGPSDLVAGGWPAAILGYPAAVTVPLSFGVMVLVSRFDRRRVPLDVVRTFARMHAPERIGMGVDRLARIDRSSQRNDRSSHARRRRM